MISEAHKILQATQTGSRDSAILMDWFYVCTYCPKYCMRMLCSACSTHLAGSVGWSQKLAALPIDAS
jgi:hypothetical protein